MPSPSLWLMPAPIDHKYRALALWMGGIFFGSRVRYKILKENEPFNLNRSRLGRPFVNLLALKHFGVKNLATHVSPTKSKNHRLNSTDIHSCFSNVHCGLHHFIHACCALAMGTAMCFAQSQLKLSEPIEYGIFQRTDKPLASGERMMVLKNSSFERTTNIPAQLGIQFGIRFRFDGKTHHAEPLTLLYLTPGIYTPEGKRQDKIQLLQAVNPNEPVDTMAFEFSESYELMQGEWVFMVFQGNELLAKQVFQVY